MFEELLREFQVHKPQLIFVRWDSLSKEQIQSLPLKIVVYIDQDFSESYMRYVVNNPYLKGRGLCEDF